MSTIGTPRPAPSQSARRFWRAPEARTRWLWIVLALAVSAAIGIWYLYARATIRFISPFTDPLRLFGIVAFALVLAAAAYTLRRRFMRGLPGMARDWLQMHIWLGIAALLVAFLHENFVSPGDCTHIYCITQYEAGSSALIALIVLVVTGVIGRLLDIWSARVIAGDANVNGIGISQAVAGRLQEVEYTVERLSAGKSALFKGYCLTALKKARIPKSQPALPPLEVQDFHRARAALYTYSQLSNSLKKQQFAKAVMRYWRLTHMALASLSLLVIAAHSLVELLKLVVYR